MPHEFISSILSFYIFYLKGRHGREKFSPVVLLLAAPFLSLGTLSLGFTWGQI